MNALLQALTSSGGSGYGIKDASSAAALFNPTAFEQQALARQDVGNLAGAMFERQNAQPLVLQSIAQANALRSALANRSMWLKALSTEPMASRIAHYGPFLSTLASDPMQAALLTRAPNQHRLDFQNVASKEAMTVKNLGAGMKSLLEAGQGQNPRSKLTPTDPGTANLIPTTPLGIQIKNAGAAGKGSGSKDKYVIKMPTLDGGEATVTVNDPNKAIAMHEKAAAIYMQRSVKATNFTRKTALQRQAQQRSAIAQQIRASTNAVGGTGAADTTGTPPPVNTAPSNANTGNNVNKPDNKKIQQDLRSGKKVRVGTTSAQLIPASPQTKQQYGYNGPVILMFDHATGKAYARLGNKVVEVDPQTGLPLNRGAPR